MVPRHRHRWKPLNCRTDPPPVTLRDELEVNVFSDLSVPVDSWRTFCICRLCGGLGDFAALFVEYL